MKALDRSSEVVVVGAGLAGWRFVEALRRGGFGGGIHVVGAEAHLPYDRPPLSKQVLSGKWPRERTQLVSPQQIGDLDIAMKLGEAAVSLDVGTRSVSLSNGATISGSHLVIATGVRARTLSFSATHAVHTVRSVDDVESLLTQLAALEPGANVVIIGGGFIGAETATSLKSLQLRPIVLEAMSRPLMNVVGDEVARWLEPLARDADVDLRGLQQVRDVVDDGDQLAVLLGDATSIGAALVVVAVGALANTQWLESSGLELNNGVVVDDHLYAQNNIWAIGDVARFMWRHDPFFEEVRIEHWQTANDHAQYLASDMLNGEEVSSALSMVPYFWSDQYGKKIQMLGHPAPDDDVTLVTGSLEEAKWLAVYSRGGVVTGLIALNQPRALMISRHLVAEHSTLDNALQSKPWG